MTRTDRASTLIARLVCAVLTYADQHKPLAALWQRILDATDTWAEHIDEKLADACNDPEEDEWLA